MKIHCKYDELISVNELKPHPRNPNKHPESQIKRLARILEYQGWRYPVKVSRASGLVTSGHGRIEAAKANGWEKVPVNFQEYESKEQEYADVVSDNSIAEWAELDLSIVRGELDGFADDFDVDLLGLRDFDLEGDERGGNTDDDDVPESPTEPRSRLGDIYELGNHRVLCGDATGDLTRLFNGQKADMVFTDPPYGVNYVGRTKEALTIQNDALGQDGTRELVRDLLSNAPLKDGGSFYVCSPAGDLETFFRLAIIDTGLLLKQCIVWVKDTFVMGRQDYHWRHESILYGWKKGAHYFVDDRTKDTCWEIARPRVNKQHPTMKPVEIPEMAINNSSIKGAIIYDCCGGSGSTLIACEKTKRKCYTVELEPKYVDVIVQRWCDYTGIYDIKVNGDTIKWGKQDGTA